MTQFFFTNETVRLVYACVYVVLAMVVLLRDVPKLGEFGGAVRRTLKDPAGDGYRNPDAEHPP